MRRSDLPACEKAGKESGMKKVGRECVLHHQLCLADMRANVGSSAVQGRLIREPPTTSWARRSLLSPHGKMCASCSGMLFRVSVGCVPPISILRKMHRPPHPCAFICFTHQQQYNNSSGRVQFVLHSSLGLISFKYTYIYLGNIRCCCMVGACFTSQRGEVWRALQ